MCLKKGHPVPLAHGSDHRVKKAVGVLTQQHRENTWRMGISGTRRAGSPPERMETHFPVACRQVRHTRICTHTYHGLVSHSPLLQTCSPWALSSGRWSGRSPVPGPCAIGGPHWPGNISSDLVEKMSAASKQPFEKAPHSTWCHPAPKARPHGGFQAACAAHTQTCTVRNEGMGRDERGASPRPPVAWGQPQTARRGNQRHRTWSHVHKVRVHIRVSTHTRTNSVLTEPSNGSRTSVPQHLEPEALQVDSCSSPQDEGPIQPHHALSRELSQSGGNPSSLGRAGRLHRFDDGGRAVSQGMQALQKLKRQRPSLSLSPGGTQPPTPCFWPQETDFRLLIQRLHIYAHWSPRVCGHLSLLP